MRKILIIALGVASLGAIAGVRSAAAYGCHYECTSYRSIFHGHIVFNKGCQQYKQVCTAAPTQPATAQGPGAQQPIQQQKLKKQF